METSIERYPMVSNQPDTAVGPLYQHSTLLYHFLCTLKLKTTTHLSNVSMGKQVTFTETGQRCIQELYNIYYTNTSVIQIVQEYVESNLSAGRLGIRQVSSVEESFNRNSFSFCTLCYYNYAERSITDIVQSAVEYARQLCPELFLPCSESINPKGDSVSMSSTATAFTENLVQHQSGHVPKAVVTADGVFRVGKDTLFSVVSNPNWWKTTLSRRKNFYFQPEKNGVGISLYLRDGVWAARKKKKIGNGFMVAIIPYIEYSKLHTVEGLREINQELDAQLLTYQANTDLAKTHYDELVTQVQKMVSVTPQDSRGFEQYSERSKVESTTMFPGSPVTDPTELDTLVAEARAGNKVATDSFSVVGETVVDASGSQVGNTPLVVTTKSVVDNTGKQIMGAAATFQATAQALVDTQTKVLHALSSLGVVAEQINSFNTQLNERIQGIVELTDLFLGGFTKRVPSQSELRAEVKDIVSLFSGNSPFGSVIPDITHQVFTYLYERFGELPGQTNPRLSASYKKYEQSSHRKLSALDLVERAGSMQVLRDLANTEFVSKNGVDFFRWALQNNLCRIQNPDVF